MTVREAEEKDLKSIREIINYYRLNSSYIWERTPLRQENMKEWLIDHSAHPYAAFVAEESGVVIGYASLSRFRAYSGYDYTAENSIYLKPEHTGKGCGTLLMNSLLSRAAANGLKVITAWIDSGNEKSIRFHEKFNFYITGAMKNVGILDGVPKSLIIMQYDISCLL